MGWRRQKIKIDGSSFYFTYVDEVRGQVKEFIRNSGVLLSNGNVQFIAAESLFLRSQGLPNQAGLYNCMASDDLEKVLDGKSLLYSTKSYSLPKQLPSELLEILESFDLIPGDAAERALINVIGAALRAGGETSTGQVILPNPYLLQKANTILDGTGSPLSLINDAHQDIYSLCRLPHVKLDYYFMADSRAFPIKTVRLKQAWLAFGHNAESEILTSYGEDYFDSGYDGFLELVDASQSPNSLITEHGKLTVDTRCLCKRLCQWVIDNHQSFQKGNEVTSVSAEDSDGEEWRSFRDSETFYVSPLMNALEKWAYGGSLSPQIRIAWDGLCESLQVQAIFMLCEKKDDLSISALIQKFGVSLSDPLTLLTERLVEDSALSFILHKEKSTRGYHNRQCQELEDGCFAIVGSFVGALEASNITPLPTGNYALKLTEYLSDLRPLKRVKVNSPPAQNPSKKVEVVVGVQIQIRFPCLDVLGMKKWLTNCTAQSLSGKAEGKVATSCFSECIGCFWRDLCTSLLPGAARHLNSVSGSCALDCVDGVWTIESSSIPFAFFTPCTSSGDSAEELHYTAEVDLSMWSGGNFFRSPAPDKKIYVACLHEGREVIGYKQDKFPVVRVKSNSNVFLSWVTPDVLSSCWFNHPYLKDVKPKLIEVKIEGRVHKLYIFFLKKRQLVVVPVVEGTCKNQPTWIPDGKYIPMPATEKWVPAVRIFAEEELQEWSNRYVNVYSRSRN